MNVGGNEYLVYHRERGEGRGGWDISFITWYKNNVETRKFSRRRGIIHSFIYSFIQSFFDVFSEFSDR